MLNIPGSAPTARKTWKSQNLALPAIWNRPAHPGSRDFVLYKIYVKHCGMGSIFSISKFIEKHWRLPSSCLKTIEPD
jgi:hypothetical protein